VIKLVAIDIDGTLLDSKGHVLPANVDAVTDAAERGIHIAVVTGRSFHFALPAVTALPDPLVMVVYNGAITRMRTGDTIMRRLLPAGEARTVLRVSEPWRDGALLQFDRPSRGQLVYDRLDWTHPNRVRFREKNHELIEEVPTLEAALVEDPIQIAFNGSVATMRALVETLRDEGIESRLSVSLTEYPRRDFSLVDVCAADTTKGATLARLASHLGVAREEVMAVGDNFNDRDMLEWAGVGVVMGNAVDEMKAGLVVTGTNDEGGLAQALRRYC
jgi:Cof subfamily protein (haloacid dehalogenase superfamily)